MANMSEGNPAPAAIASVPGSVDNAARQARANAASEGIRRQHGKFESYADILLDAKPYNTGEYDLPNSAFMKGQYLPRNEEMDRRLAAWFSLPEGGSNVGPNGNPDGLNWGVKQQPTELLLDYAESKYGQGQYRAVLDLAAMLIDAKDPRTQEQAFALVPELRDVPRERSVKIYKMHFMLESILRTGTITTVEELYFIYELLNPKSQIPLMPTWMEIVNSDYGDVDDLSDLYANVSLGKGSAVDTDPVALQLNEKSLFGVQYQNGNAKPYSLFDPFTHTLAPKTAPSADPQIRIKYVIMRRLFPALRTCDTAVLKTVLDKIYTRNEDGVALIAQLSKAASVNGLYNKQQAGGIGAEAFRPAMRGVSLRGAN